MKLKYLISALLIVAACDDFKQENILPQEPSVPTEVVGMPAEDEFTLNFQWAATEGAIEYAYVLKDRNGDIVDYGKTSATSMSFSDLSKGYKYTFEVKAVNGAAESEFCQAVEAVVGGVELQPYGTLALELYSMDGDVQVDTLTVIAQDAQSNVFKTGFKDVALTDQPKKFRMLYLTEGEYSNIKFEIKYTKNGEMCEYSMPVDGNVTVVCDETVSVSAPVLAYDENDFYSVWYHGRDITIAGQTVNRAICPKAQIRTMSELSWTFLSSPYDHETDGGILFVENSEYAYKATAATRTIGKDRIIIGRYRNANQPIFKINGTGTYYWVLDGKVRLKNITISSYQTSRCLFLGKSGAAHGVSEFYFDDCTLINTNTSYGMFIELDALCAVPKSMRFDNCILRANAAFFGASGRKNNAAEGETNAYFASMQNLKSLMFNNCVFAPATLAEGKTDVMADQTKRLETKGVLIALYHNNYPFDDLDVSFSYCSTYDMAAPQGAQGMVDFTTVRNLDFDHCVFYNTKTINNMWLANTLLKCNGAKYTVTATYSNKVGDYMLKYGPKSNFTNNGGTCSATITEQNELFGICEPAKHYFPISSAVSNAGASYDTKYWIVPTSQPSEEPTQTPE